MPFVSIITNVGIGAEATEVFLSQLTQLVVNKLSKPKEYVQVTVNGGQAMQFAGTSEPTAFVELRALGLSEELAKPMATELTQLVRSALSITPDRIFINLMDVPRSRWGWNGSTFG